MKCLSILLLVFLIPLYSIQAQKLTKAEKKVYRQRGIELKKEFKKKFKNNPEKFLEFREGIDSSELKVNSLNNELVEYQSSLTNIEASLEVLKRAKEIDEQKIAQLQSQIKTGKTRKLPTTGSFYTVQTNENNPDVLMKVLEDNPQNLTVTQDENGKDTYILGVYDTTQLAFELKKHLHLMGLQKPFVVLYEDGKIINHNVKEPNKSKMMSKK
jgi:septal ring factor EnvC (AmiA/AmiB activator)